MKIGVCAPPEKIAFLSELGYDYMEGHFSVMAALDGAAFREKTALIERSPLAVETFNGFFAGEMKLYAPDGDHDPVLYSVRDYCERSFPRAALWGGKVAVIGSGGARAIPEGMTRDETEAQFARVLAVCGEVAEKHGMTVAVEPLSRNECNYLHTVSEGAEVTRLSGHPAVGVLVDFFHHWKNGEDLSTLPDHADLLLHAHYARPGDRNAPNAEDEASLRGLAEVLKKCPKIERISLECVWQPDYDTAVREARGVMEIFKGL